MRGMYKGFRFDFFLFDFYFSFDDNEIEKKDKKIKYE